MIADVKSAVVPAPFSICSTNKPTGRKTGKGYNMADQNMENTQTTQEGTQQGAGQQSEKLFTQADVDRIVGNRLARMKQDMETTDTYRRERDEARRELERYKNDAFLKEQGVAEHFRDYVTFRAMQGVNDTTNFQQAAVNFLKENPAYAGKGFRVVSTGKPNGGSGVSNEDPIRKAMGLK